VTAQILRWKSKALDGSTHFWSDNFRTTTAISNRTGMNPGASR
jgi:hypothetical protein